MSIYLKTGTADNETGDLNVNLNFSTVGNYIEFECFASAGNNNEDYVLGGQDTGDGFFIRLETNQVTVRAVDFMVFSNNYTKPAIGETFVFRVVRASSSTYECFLNQVSLGVGNSTNNLSIDQFFNVATSADKAFHGGTYRVSYSSNGGVSVTNEWNPTTSNTTTGLTLFDTVGSENVTLNNFPSDDSQWVFVELPTIDNIDTDNTVTDGQQTVPMTVSGFSGDITSVNLKVGTDTVALTGIAGTGTSYTFNMNDVTAYTVNTVGLPFSSLAYQNQIEVTDGTDTATIDITREPKAGWAIVETVDAVATKGSIFEGRTGGAPFDGSQIYYPTASNTSISATGIITTDIETVNGFVWDVTSKTWEVWSFDASAADIPLINRRNMNASAAYLRTQGFSGTVNEVILSWLVSKGYNGQVNDAMYKYWEGLLLKGGYNDKHDRWKRG